MARIEGKGFKIRASGFWDVLGTMDVVGTRVPGRVPRNLVHICAAAGDLTSAY